MQKDNDRKNLIYFPLGTFGRDMVYALVTNFLLTFILFTQSLDASQLTAITAIMIGARIFDALNDPVMGNIIERTRSRWGKFKPYLISGILLTSLVVYLMFNTGLEGWPFVVFFGIIYFSYSIAYTMHDISYWGMIPALSRDQELRNKFTSRTTLVAGIGGTLANILIPMLTAGAFAIGGSSRIAFGRIALAVGIIAPVFLLITVLKVREDRSDMEKQAPKVSFRKIFSTVRYNDQLLWCALFLLLQQIGNGIALSGLGSTYIYFEFGYEGGLFSLYTTLGMLPTAFLMIFYPSLSRKFGRIRLVKGLSLIAGIGYAATLLFGLIMPSGMAKFALITIGYMFSNFGQYGLYLIAMISILNTVEYNEYMRGERDEAIIASLRPFFTKLASALTVLIATGTYIIFGVLKYTNGISDYENLAARGLISESEKLNSIGALIQSATKGEANSMLITMCILPLLLLVISSALYLKKYRLDEKTYDAICAELEAREHGNN